MRFLLLPAVLLALSLPVGATSEATDAEAKAEAAYAAFLESVPEEVKEFLPTDFFEHSLENGESSLQEAGSVQSILRAIGRILGLSLGDALRLLARITGLLVLCAIFRSLAPEGSAGLSRALTLCTSLCLAPTHEPYSKTKQNPREYQTQG